MVIKLVVVGNSSQLSSRNTRTSSAVNLVEITQEGKLFHNVFQPGNITGYFLAGNLIRELHENSCSHRNFSTRLGRKLFGESTRSQRNLYGKMGKSKFHPVIMEYVKSPTFWYYPLEGYKGEQQE